MNDEGKAGFWKLRLGDLGTTLLAADEAAALVLPLIRPRELRELLKILHLCDAMQFM